MRDAPMTKNIIHTITLLLTLCSCASQYDIAGKSSLEEVDGHMVYLRVVGGGDEVPICSIDSCRVVHGRFRFGGDIDSVVLAQVCVGKGLQMPIVLEREPVQISIDPIGQMVNGGQLNKRLYDFLQKRDRLENQLWQAEQECIRTLRTRRSSIVEAQEQLRKRAHKLNGQIEDAEVRFVADNYSNALGTGYFIMLCNQQIFPVMTEQLQRIVDKAPAAFIAHPYIRNYLIMADYDFSRRGNGRR